MRWCGDNYALQCGADLKEVCNLPKIRYTLAANNGLTF